MFIENKINRKKKRNDLFLVKEGNSINISNLQIESALVCVRLFSPLIEFKGPLL
jgi:hypothetical protein